MLVSNRPAEAEAGFLFGAWCGLQLVWSKFNAFALPFRQLLLAFFSPPFVVGGTCLGEKPDGMCPKTRSTMGKKVLLVGLGVWNQGSNLKLHLLLSL